MIDQKTVQASNNWAALYLRGHGYRGQALMFRHAPVDKQGHTYPAIDADMIVNAAIDVGIALQHQLEFSDFLAGICWEIATKYENGEYPERPQSVLDLVCALHAHLGSFYSLFIEEKQPRAA